MGVFFGNAHSSLKLLFLAFRNHLQLMTIQYALELTGTFFFAISGALALQHKEHDWFAAAFIGFITAIGGGTLRDVLLGSYPLAWIGDINLLYAILVGIVIT